jgi:hypothetical protein
VGVNEDESTTRSEADRRKTSVFMRLFERLGSRDSNPNYLIQSSNISNVRNSQEQSNPVFIREMLSCRRSEVISNSQGNGVKIGVKCIPAERPSTVTLQSWEEIRKPAAVKEEFTRTTRFVVAAVERERLLGRNASVREHHVREDGHIRLGIQG